MAFTLLDGVLFLGGLLLVVHLYFKYKFSYWSKRSVPYFEPSVPFGNIKEVLFQQKNVGQFLRKLYFKSSGKPVMGFYIFGKPALLIRDPDWVKQILIKDFNVFFDRHVSSNHNVDPLSNNLFLLKGAPWKYLRTKLNPTFTTFRIKQVFPLMEKCSKQFVEYLCNNAGPDNPIETKEVTAKYATDVITSCAFGIESNSLSDPKAEFREFGRKVFDITPYRSFEFMSFWLIPQISKIVNGKFFSDQTTAFLRKAFWDTINQREEKNIVRNDFLQLLIQLKNKGQVDEDKNDHEMLKYKKMNPDNESLHHNTDFELDGDNLLAQAAIFFIAGFETNATTASFTLYNLAMQPDIQKRLRKEILEVLKRENGQLSYEAIRDMQYLHMVVSETLRKFPPLSVLDRIPNRDYTFPGTNFKLEKGVPVFIPLLGLHYDPDVFPDPERYDPERFNEENKKNIHPCMYLPFGGGPKRCIGEHFGLIAAKAGLVHVVSQFEISPCEGTPQHIELSPRAMILATTAGIPLKYTRIK